MRIVSAEVYPLRFPMRETFKIARGAVGSRAEGAPHIYFRMVSDNGLEGWGEARPSPRWSYETQESVTTTLRNYLVPAIIGADLSDLPELHRRMEREIAPGITVGQPIAKSAIDMAAWDLVCKSKGLSLLSSLGGAAKQWPMGLIISAESAADAESRAGDAVSRKFSVLKVKIGLDPASDVKILEAVKRAAPQAYIWADANQAYDLETAFSLLRSAAKLGVDVLEQPLPANDYSGLKELRRHSQIPIALDESVFAMQDLEQLIRLECLDALVIKVSKMAGITHAKSCIELAKSYGLTVLGSGLTESRLGFHASAALYAAYGIDKCDLNGPQFLADDAVSGEYPVAEPLVNLPIGPGFGVEIDDDKLARYKCTPRL